MWGRAFLTGLAILAAGAAGVIPLLTSGSSDQSPEAHTTTNTVSAERRTLTDSETVSGALGYDDPVTLSASVAVGVLTWLPSDGDVIGRGDVAYRVDNEPVVLLTGALPLYRELYRGISDGADVHQLEQNLEALGYDPGTVDDSFTESTREAVEDLQEAVGQEETGRVSTSDFAVFPHTIRAGAAKATLGTQLQPGTELYSASSTRRVITVDLDASAESLARIGAKATVTLPDGTATPATIARVGSAATPSSPTDASGSEAGEPSAAATIPVTLRLKKPRDLGRLSSAPVTVELTRKAKKDVVTVPVTALVALAEGGFGVRTVEGTASTLVGVEPGLYSGGYVEVVSGLRAGDVVEVPR